MMKMHKHYASLLAAGLTLGLPGVATAGNTAQQTVTFEVTAIDEISVSGNPAALTINSATAGSAPTAVQDTSTSYAITTNGGADARKITAAIDSDMPAGTTLQITLATPTGGSSAGASSLSTTAADVVTAIDSVAESGLQITYDFAATAAAGVVASDTRTVTLTLTTP